MKKKSATILIILVILVFIGYIVFDVAFGNRKKEIAASAKIVPGKADQWIISKTLETGIGKLKAVTVSSAGNIFLGGDSFVLCYDPDYKALWNLKTEKAVVALTVSGDSILAATQETILVVNGKGEILDEWGPFEDNAIITSIACNRSFVAFADAANKIIVVLSKKGEVKSMIGKTGEPFIIPSPYFDVTLDDKNNLYAANTGNRRIEIRTIVGTLLRYFGEPGLAPEAFCGCCNPAHFTLIPDGFVTAEKGINRIKILNKKGDFIEFVSSENDFMPAVPLDIASYDGKTIYAANPADSKLYVFKRKVNNN
jgi:cbb3-type cytochrome oxidase subunit 3